MNFGLELLEVVLRQYPSIFLKVMRGEGGREGEREAEREGEREIDTCRYLYEGDKCVFFERE